jgi:predicted nucleotidyltransferase
VLKGTARTATIDLLVEFEPEPRPPYFALPQSEPDLSPFLGGKRIDLRTPVTPAN